MSLYHAESFPCLVCGKSLERVMDEYEAQPHEGLMCSTSGNYGSTVFDSFDLSYLTFNICDECMVRAGEQGRVMVTRQYRPVMVSMMGMVGREKVNRPYIPWHKGLVDDEDSINVEPEEIQALVDAGRIELMPHLTPQVIIEYVEEMWRRKEEKNND